MSVKHTHPPTVCVKRASHGLGLFAAVPFKKDETIIEYVGKRISSKTGDALQNNSYIFSVSGTVDIDGSPRWNTARYANHSCRPSCEAINRRGRVFIVARRNMRPGDEITYDYGRDYFNGFIRPLGCQCVKCAGPKTEKSKPVAKKVK